MDHLVSSPPQIVECKRVFGFHPSFQARIIFDPSLPLVPGCFLFLIVAELARFFSSCKLHIWRLKSQMEVFFFFLELALHGREFIVMGCVCVCVCVLKYGFNCEGLLLCSKVDPLQKKSFVYLEEPG